MARNVSPSEDAVKQRTEAEQAIPLVAQKAAAHIVSQLEPSFSEAYARGDVDTFENFVLGQKPEISGTHSRVIDDEWFKKNNVHGHIGEVCREAEPIVQQLLMDQYEISAIVNIHNGGSPEFVFDWYTCHIWRPRKKRSFWRFWQR